MMTNLVMMKKNCARTCGYCKPKKETKTSDDGGGAGGGHEGGASSAETTHEKSTKAKMGAGIKRGTPLRRVDRDCKDTHPLYVALFCVHLLPISALVTVLVKLVTIGGGGNSS